MAYVDDNDVLRVSPRWRYTSAADIVNVLHLKVGTDTPTAWSDVAADIAGFLVAMYDPIISHMATGVVHAGTQVQNVTQGTILPPLSSTAYLDGTNVGDALPPQITCLCLFHTLYSRVQGRIYLPTFTETEQTAGAWSAGVVSDVEDALDYLLLPQTMVNGTTLRYCVQSTSHGALYPLSRAMVTSPRVQRRRRIGAGS